METPSMLHREALQGSQIYSKVTDRPDSRGLKLNFVVSFFTFCKRISCLSYSSAPNI